MKTLNTRLLGLLQRYEEQAAAGTAPDLEDLCAADPDLLPALREAVRLLAGFGERFERVTTLPEDGPPAAPRPVDVPGFVLGEELGRGGMGVVYRAEQTALKRTVAVKMILASHLAGPAARERFRREAQAVARLRHPGIVQVYEVGTWAAPDGSQGPYIALEYLAGGTLARKLAGQPQPGRDAAGLVRRLAEAMHHAHAAGVVHRDLKPGNVLLTDDGEAKIADFGLARLLDEADAGETRTGAVFGTPSYMAPEQARGDNKAVGPATDVWALGAVLYECLTGRPPFRGTTPAETLRLVAEADPVAPRALNPAVPPDVETVCLKALRKEPGQRYVTAQALADDLGRFLAGRPIHARPVGRVERAAKWVRRNPVVAALALATVLALAGGFAVALTLYGQAVKESGLKDVALGEKDDALKAEGAALKDRTAALGQAREAERRATVAAYAGHVRAAATALAGGDLDAARRALLGGRWDLAGWEYDHLWHALERREEALARSLGSPGRCVLVGPGGRWRAALYPGLLLLFDAAGRPAASRDVGTLGELYAPAGGEDLVLTEARPKPRVAWLDPATGAERRSRDLPEGAVPCGLAPDGAAVVVFRPGDGPRQPGTVALLDLATGREDALAVAPRGGVAVLFDPAAGRIVVAEVAFQPGPTAYARLTGLDRASGEELWRVEGGAGPAALRLAGLTPRGEVVVQPGEAAPVRLLDGATGAAVREVGVGDAADPDRAVRRLFLDPAGERLGWIDRAGAFGVRDLARDRDSRRVRPTQPDPDAAAAFDGDRLLVARAGLVYRLALAAPADPPAAAGAADPSGRWLLQAERGRVRVVPAGGGPPVRDETVPPWAVAAWARDGTLVLSGHDLLRWIDLAAGREFAMPRAGPGVAYHDPASRVLVVVAEKVNDPVAALDAYDLDTGRHLWRREVTWPKPARVAIGPGGGLVAALVSVAAGFAVRVWDAAGEEVHASEASQAPPGWLGFAADGRLAVAFDAAVHWWDPATRRGARVPFATPLLQVRAGATLGDRLFLLQSTGPRGRSVEVIHGPTGEGLLSLAVDQTADWDRLAVAAGRVTLAGTEYPAGDWIPPPGERRPERRSVARSWDAGPRRFRLASPVGDTTARMTAGGRLVVGERWYDLATGQGEPLAAALPGTGNAAQPTGPRDDYLLLPPTRDEPAARLIDRATGRPVATFPLAGLIGGNAVSPDGGLWAACVTTGTAPTRTELVVFDLAAGAVRWRDPVPPPGGPVAFSPSGGLLAFASPGRPEGPTVVRVYDAASGKSASVLDAKFGTPAEMRFTADGAAVLLQPAGSQGTPGPVLLDRATRQPLGLVPAGTLRATLSADGATLARIDPGGAARVFDVATGRLRFERAAAHPSTLLLAPDGRRLVLGVPDGSLHVWDVP